MDAHLEAISINKSYEGHHALTDLSLQIPKGSIFGLLGPNGAGKTSFIRIINQITAPDSGKLLLNGKPLTANDIGKIGYLPEERGLYKKMKVGEQAMYLCRLKGLSNSEAKAKLKHWFERFEITDWWDKKIEELSKGMAQKVQFIVTVLHQPELLIFDEPFTGFDPINTELIKSEIKRLNNEGATIIFSTHRMESVEEICDHIALINKSRKILEGPLKSVQDDYRTNTYRVAYVGDVNQVTSKIKESFTLVDDHSWHDHREATVKLPDGTKPNALLEALLPLATIDHFEEVIPSVNDIFIRNVQNRES
ncbi:ABC transporter ATP-binding protein [Phaeocystidibacter marisrubri]|uniref:ABC transporter ATP-binding protein n=1 Tax=Phaeocystidibacter marisrubri TaxID=1577780 RepID=A0A6L3ZGV4_9FLAO|nr:ATP-binding cassette domain-containing protein [Phaeocystidibacter marisrubri]KAB2817067.1 ABC transporter ATP-binding protein [Phaeocystidibacter marisrubri]GGH76991.1 ABC transporter ATP-binding protein [Phaeocystidibacter marisrubri]